MYNLGEEREDPCLGVFGMNFLPPKTSLTLEGSKLESRKDFETLSQSIPSYQLTIVRGKSGRRERGEVISRNILEPMVVW